MKVTKVDVDQGRVRLEDRLGNIEADTAADSGRRHQSEEVMDVRRVLLKAQECWYPTMLQLRRSIMMGVLARPLTLLYGIRRVVVSNASGFRFMVGASLVLILLPGLCCQSAVPVICIGLLVLGKWCTLVFLTWRFSFSLSNVGCSVKRLAVLIFVHCRFISILVRALGKLPGGLGKFLPLTVGGHMSRLGVGTVLTG